MRIIHLLFLVSFLLHLTACSSQQSDFLLGGIQVNEPDAREWIASLKENNFNTVAVTIYAHQGDWDSDTLWFETENDGVLTEIREAKQAGLKVVFILRLALDHAYPRNEFLWHGMVWPRNEELLDSWFRKYSAFVLHWVKIAEAQGVDYIGIGSELNSMTSTRTLTETPALLAYYLDTEKQERQRASLLAGLASVEGGGLSSSGTSHYAKAADIVPAQQAAQQRWARTLCSRSGSACVATLNARRKRLQTFWLGLIEDCRMIYSKSIGYAANFDQFQEVGFWDALDFMGINAYFPLRRFYNVRPLPEVLQQSWQTVFTKIRQIQGETSSTTKPVFFTELGYTSREGATLEPWSSQGYSLSYGSDQSTRAILWEQQAHNTQERLAAIRALHTIHQRNPDLLKGILYWKLSTDPNHRSIEPFVSILGSAQDSAFNTVLQSFRDK